MKNFVYLFFMVSFVTYPVYSDENIESDYEQLLLNSCQGLTTSLEHENVKPCIYFIQGFLAAAQAIDPPIINQKTKNNRKSYGLTSRSYSNWEKILPTREKIPPTRFFHYCVPDDEPKAQVALIVSKQLSAQKTDSTKALRDIIFQALKAEYPCT